MSAVLRQLLSSGPWAAGLALGELARRWREVVGERLAEESSPTRLENGVLVVRASSAAWGAQIGFLSNEIRSRAARLVAEQPLRQVRVIVDPEPKRR